MKFLHLFALPLMVGCSGSATDGDTDDDDEAGECADYRVEYPSSGFGFTVGSVVADFPGMVNGDGEAQSLEDIYVDRTKTALVIANAFDTWPACNTEAALLESFLSEYPEIELVNIMCTASGGGSAALASSWGNSHNLENVQVWGDVQDYVYTNFVQYLGGSYPNTMVIDLETMELVYFDVGAVDSAVSAIEGIINAEHPCAE